MTLPHSGRPDTDDARAEDERELLEAVVPLEHAGRRFDQALADLFPDFSRSRLTSWIKSGEALLDGAEAKPKQALRGGETVTVWVTPSIETTAEPEAIALDLRHADEDVIVLNKPAGLVVHPGAGNPRGTLVNALLHFDPKLAELPRAGIVHRLDKDTSGLMVVARTLRAHASLVEQLSSREVHRQYLAVACGAMVAGGTVDAPIGRHPTDRIRQAVNEGGREAVTHYRVRERFRSHTLVECRLETGRTHQIRVHLAHAGFPIAGDDKYGDFTLNRQLVRAGHRRMFLHAARLSLRHPVDGRPLTLEAPTPAAFASLAARQAPT